MFFKMCPKKNKSLPGNFLENFITQIVGSLFLQIYAVDAGSVTSILYTLQPQDGFGIFGISSETGIVFIKMRDPQVLDYEGTKHYYLQVRQQTTHKVESNSHPESLHQGC